MKIIKRLFCNHDFEFNSNIHGDMVIMMGYNRSIWKCTKYDKYTQRKIYVDDNVKKRLLRLKKLKKLQNEY